MKSKEMKKKRKHEGEGLGDKEERRRTQTDDIATCRHVRQPVALFPLDAPHRVDFVCLRLCGAVGGGVYWVYDGGELGVFFLTCWGFWGVEGVEAGDEVKVCKGDCIGLHGWRNGEWSGRLEIEIISMRKDCCADL